MIMTAISKFPAQRFAKFASHLMRYACYFAILFYVLCLLLSVMGRQTFALRTDTGYFENAIFAETNHNPPTRSMTVHMESDSIYVHSVDSTIDPMVQVSLSLMYAVNVIPLIFAYVFLSKVFANVAKGEIFTDKNAAYLLYYGILQLFVALFVPFIKILICQVNNWISADTISIGTGSNMIVDLFPSIAFMVAAYIVHYGITLQDEVDHTL